MPNVDIHFRTAAELAGARAVQQQLEKQIGQAKALGKDYKGLEEQLAKVNARIKQSGQEGGFKDLIGQVPGLEGVSRALGAIGTKAGAAAAALGGMLLGLKQGIETFAKAEEVVATLDQALAQNGLLTEANREQYQQLASELQRLTAIADDEWIAVLTRLTQFGSKPETIGIDVEAVKNLAGLMDGNLRRAAETYSRALQGQFEMFTEVGIVIDHTATQTEKLNGLQLELARRGGGQLEARARSLNGIYRQFKANLADTAEAMGRGVAQTGMLQAVLGTASSAMEFWAEKLGGTVPKLGGLINQTDEATNSILRAREEAKRFADELAEIKEESGEAAAGLAHLHDQTDRHFRDEERHASLRRKAAFSDLERRKAFGEIGEADFLKARAALEERFDREALAREEERVDLKMRANDFEMRRRQDQIRELERELGIERELLNLAEKKAAEFAGPLARARQLEKEDKAHLDDLLRSHESGSLALPDSGFPVPGHVLDELIGKARRVHAMRTAEVIRLRKKQLLAGGALPPGVSLPRQREKVGRLEEELATVEAQHTPVIQDLFFANEGLGKDRAFGRAQFATESGMRSDALDSESRRLAEQQLEQQLSEFRQWASRIGTALRGINRSGTDAELLNFLERLLEDDKALKRRLDDFEVRLRGQLNR